jgi:carbamoylphosphate synthase large subunit
VQDEPLVVQEALEGDEYTTTLVCTGEEENRVLRSVTLWREPKYGPGHEFVRREVREDHPTYTADEWGGRKALIHQIAEQLGIIGPCNIQWRDVPNRGPVVFEINARFPGSTVLCALAGVNLPDIAVQYFLFGHAPSMEPAQPLTFLRTLGEVAVPTTSIIPKPLCK